LIEWQPKLNGSGVTLAGSVNIDRSPGVNVGAELTVGVEGTQVERAGRDALHGTEGDAEWNIDFDDFSDTPGQRVALDFFAYWRCPKQSTFVPVTPSLDFEIDQWGSDRQYKLRFDEEAGEFQLASLSTTDELPAPLPGDGQYAVLIEAPGPILPPDQGARFRARVYGEVVPPGTTVSLGFAGVEVEPAPLALVETGTLDGVAFAEFRGTVPVAAFPVLLTPVASASFPAGDGAQGTGAPLAVIERLPAGGALTLGPGRHAVALSGEPGSLYSVSFTPTPSLGVAVRRDLNADPVRGAVPSIVQVTDLGSVLLDVVVRETESPIELLATPATAPVLSRTLPLLLGLAVGLAFGIVLCVARRSVARG
jgi:hypothetical protein